MKIKNLLKNLISGMLAAAIAVGSSSFQDGGTYLSKLFTGVTVKADNSDSDFVINSNNELVKYTGSDKLVEIPYGVTSILSEAFYQNRAVEKIIIPESVKKIDAYAFHLADGLEEIYIPDSVTSIGDYAFYLCVKLKNIRLPEGIKEISSSCFSYCSSLESIVIPDSVQKLSNSVFYSCLSLKNVKLGENLSRIESSCFSGCESLETICFNKNIEFIRDYIFSDCPNLTSIVIPTSFISFSTKTFYQNAISSITSLKTIYYEGSRDQWTKVQFKNHIPENIDIQLNYSRYKGCSATIGQDFKINLIFGEGQQFVNVNGENFELDSEHKLQYGIAAKDFDKDIKLDTYGGNYTANFNNMIQYYKTIPDYSSNISFKNTLDTLEVFCKASKQYFTDGGVVEPVSASIDSSYKYTITGECPDGIEYLGNTLNLKDLLYLNYYFKLDDNKTFEDYTIKYKQKFGEYKELTSDDFEMKGEYYCFKSHPMNWANADFAYTLIISDSEKEYTVKYSPLSYCCLVQNSKETGKNLKNLCNSLYNFWKAANSYLYF